MTALTAKAKENKVLFANFNQAGILVANNSRGIAKGTLMSQMVLVSFVSTLIIPKLAKMIPIP